MYVFVQFVHSSDRITYKVLAKICSNKLEKRGKKSTVYFELSRVFQQAFFRQSSSSSLQLLNSSRAYTSSLITYISSYFFALIYCLLYMKALIQGWKSVVFVSLSEKRLFVISVHLVRINILYFSA